MCVCAAVRLCGSLAEKKGHSFLRRYMQASMVGVRNYKKSIRRKRMKKNSSESEATANNHQTGR